MPRHDIIVAQAVLLVVGSGSLARGDGDQPPQLAPPPTISVPTEQRCYVNLLLTGRKYVHAAQSICDGIRTPVYTRVYVRVRGDIHIAAKLKRKPKRRSNIAISAYGPRCTCCRRQSVRVHRSSSRFRSAIFIRSTYASMYVN